MDITRGGDHKLGVPAWKIRPNQTKICAAIRLANPARITLSAADERLDHDKVAFLDVRHTFANHLNGAAQFVPCNAWIIRIRIFAGVNVEITRANSRRANLHLHFAGRKMPRPHAFTPCLNAEQ